MRKHQLIVMLAIELLGIRDTCREWEEFITPYIACCPLRGKNRLRPARRKTSGMREEGVSEKQSLALLVIFSL